MLDGGEDHKSELVSRVVPFKSLSGSLGGMNSLGAQLLSASLPLWRDGWTVTV